MSTKNEVTALGLRRMWSNPTGEQDSSEGDTKAVTYDTLQQTPGIWKNRGMDLLDSPEERAHLERNKRCRGQADQEEDVDPHSSRRQLPNEPFNAIEAAERQHKSKEHVD